MATDTKLASENKSNSTVTVVIACKHPHGLLLQLHAFSEVPEPVMGGGTRTVKLAHPAGEPVHIHGPNAPFGEAPKAEVVGGYALTHGVPKEFWDKWCEQNKGCAILKNELIFAYEKGEDAKAKAKENKAVRTGMEPVNPAEPPRLGRHKVETDKDVSQVLTTA